MSPLAKLMMQSSSTQEVTSRKSCLISETATCAISWSYITGRENKRTNNRTMLGAPKNNAAAGYHGPVKMALLKGASLLKLRIFHAQATQFLRTKAI